MSPRRGSVGSNMAAAATSVATTNNQQMEWIYESCMSLQQPLARALGTQRHDQVFGLA